MRKKVGGVKKPRGGNGSEGRTGGSYQETIKWLGVHLKKRSDWTSMPSGKNGDYEG